jgi:excinuclease ABC subunit C
MNVLPVHIECFDNSNIQGDFAVAAMVVFKNGKPAASEYRHYNIKTVSGPDDYASMEEVVYRRYKRLVEENKPLPQLIVIDGGRGQLNSAKESLEKLELFGKIHLISIAKKLEEIYLPDDGIPLHISKKSETMKVLTHIRDEAHRFGITHHRNKRSEETIKTELTSIPGIGPLTIQKLLDEFKSVEGIRNATAEAIQAMIGNAKTKIVLDYFKRQG